MTEPSTNAQSIVPEFGHALREFREMRGLSRSAMGAMLGCSGEALRAYELGQQRITALIADRIESTLDIAVPVGCVTSKTAHGQSSALIAMREVSPGRWFEIYHGADKPSVQRLATDACVSFATMKGHLLACGVTLRSAGQQRSLDIANGHRTTPFGSPDNNRRTDARHKASLANIRKAHQSNKRRRHAPEIAAAEAERCRAMAAAQKRPLVLRACGWCGDLTEETEAYSLRTEFVSCKDALGRRTNHGHKARALCSDWPDRPRPLILVLLQRFVAAGSVSRDALLQYYSSIEGRPAEWNALLRTITGEEAPPAALVAATARRRGSSHHNCKLSDTSVQEILDLLRSGEFSQQEIGRAYGVSQGHVSAIKLGRGRLRAE